MFDSNITHRDTQITVLPNRQRFEAAVSRVLSHHSGEEDCAVLHVALRCGSGTGSVSMRMLNLAGNALRSGMRRGHVAYLGDAEFAVLLQDTDAREAAAYARTMALIISSFRVHWEDEILTAEASVGGVMAGDGQLGSTLLHQAHDATGMAKIKAGCKVHMTHAPAPVAMREPAMAMLEASFA